MKGGRVAGLAVLLHDLTERISNKEGGFDTQLDDDDPVIVRFRSLLPSLLETFGPVKVKEREFTTILKLLKRTVTLHPAVYCHGKGHAVLPVMARIIPLLSEPSRRAHHDVLFATLCSLASILRNGDPDTYVLLFSGALTVLEDMLPVASYFSSAPSRSACTHVSLQCHVEAYEAVAAFPSLESQQKVAAPLRESPDGPGLSVDVTGDERWLPFTVWTLKLISHCLTEGPLLLLEGLLSFSFVETVGALLSYGHTDLRKHALEVLHLATTHVGTHMFRSERLISSLLYVVSQSVDVSEPSRDSSYHSKIGSCLTDVHKSSAAEMIESTAKLFVDVLQEATVTTTSTALRVSMFQVYGAVLKHCPAYSKYLALLLHPACMPEMSEALSSCFQLALDLLGYEVVAGFSTEPVMQNMDNKAGQCNGVNDETAVVSHRNLQELLPFWPVVDTGQASVSNDNQCPKRQKTGFGKPCLTEAAEPSTEAHASGRTSFWTPRNKGPVEMRLISDLSPERSAKLVAQILHLRLLEVIGSLLPNAEDLEASSNDKKLASLSALARNFSGFPGTPCKHYLLRQSVQWIPWLQKTAGDGSLTAPQLTTFFEAIDRLLSEKGTCGRSYVQDGTLLAFRSDLMCFVDASEPSGCALVHALELPWSISHIDPDLRSRTKCRALSILVKVSSQIRDLGCASLLKLAHTDEDVAVRAAAVKSLPLLAVGSGGRSIREIGELFCSLRTDVADSIRKAVARNIGHIACAYFTSQLDAQAQADHVTTCLRWGEVVCPACDVGDCLSKRIGGSSSDSRSMEGCYIVGGPTCIFPLDMLQLLFSHLLFGETSEQVQVAFIESLGRLMHHMTVAELQLTRAEWLKCLNVLPVHHRRAVREAFGSQVHGFVEKKILEGLFDIPDEDPTSSRELQMLGNLKYALHATADPDVLETLVETVAVVAQAARHSQQLFFFSLVLIIEQLDNSNVSIQVKSIRLLHKIADVGWPSRGCKSVHMMVDSHQQKLFQYLCSRIISRPFMVKQVAEAVLSMELSQFLKRMIPTVLPQLILDLQRNPNTLGIMQELARLLETELPYLLVDFCHQVLSVLLLRADGSELLAALQFYETQTGSETREIFAAVLPALLDELVRFLGDVESEDAAKRSARVAPMIQEVASIVTGSDDLPNFLRTHFVGLLNSIDRKLLRAPDLVSQTQALRCIERLIDMIGVHLSAFVPKIMALLTRALQEQSLQEYGLAVWLSFVQTLARIAPSNLKNIASQIVVALMPCLEAHLEEETPHITAVVSVLEELIIRNGRVLEDQICELPLLPTHNKLAKVNGALHDAKGSLSFRDQLQQAVDGISHESLSVQYITARELIKWMRNKRKDLAGMILGENIQDASVVSGLTAALLRGCSEESRTAISQRFRMACAECLGELGAVDPLKLQVNPRHRSKIEKCDEDLVFELINVHLAKMLRAATDTDVQDAAALAIQELLKLSGCRGDLLGVSPTRPPEPSKAKTRAFNADALSNTRTMHTQLSKPNSTESGEQLWRRFSEDVKEIITPCLTSKYHLRNPSAVMPAGPIFRSGISFRRWIYLWVRKLVAQARGGRADIFTACRGLLRHDIGTALYLLPHLVLNVICFGEQNARDDVTNEILAVLAEAATSTAEAASSPDVTVAKGHESWSGPTEMSTQCVFSLLDNLGQWLDESKTAASHSQEEKIGNRVQEREERAAILLLQHTHVGELLEAIPKQVLAGASFRCQAYARALMYFELHVRATSGALNPAAHVSGTINEENVTLLLQIFSGLDELDGLTGLSRLRKSVSLQDQILIHEKTGNWAEALTCCEQALQLQPTSIDRHSGVLNCLLNMGHLQAMVTHVDGLILRFPNNKKEWCLRGVQAAWRLGQWDLIDEYVKGALVGGPLSLGADSTAAFDIWLAKMLQALQGDDHVSFQAHLAECRESLLAPLAAASMESYSRAYPLIVKLHMLKELEDFHSLTCRNEGNGRNECLNDSEMLKIAEEWEHRLELTQKTLWAREPILALRRLVFQTSRMPSEVGSCWLQYAKLCRTAGHYEAASRAIWEAQLTGAPNVHMEKAKYFWVTGKSHPAILEIQQAIPSAHVVMNGSTVATGTCVVPQRATHLPSGTEVDVRQEGISKSVDLSQLRRDNDRDVSKMLLLLARWVHHTGQMHRDDVIKLFSRCRELQPRWEMAFFYVAKYYDDLLVDARRRQEEGQENNADMFGAANPRRKVSAGVIADDKAWYTYLSDCVLYYAKGLHRGHRRLFQALPRLLTLWFEFGTKYRGEKLAMDKSAKAVHAKMLTVMRGCLKELPSYQWLTALSQLVSRICHPNEDVVKLVKFMITTVIRAHPQQALWTMAAVSKSTIQARREAAAEVLRQAANGGDCDKMLFVQFAGFVEQMIKLCFFGGDPKAKYISIAADFGVLKRMMPVKVIMPVQQALTISLPADGLPNSAFDPFGVTDKSTIHGIRDEVEVLASLQKPKKVVLLSGDGVEHPFLCKPKDDLRKDARMMEFTTMINRLLFKDPKSCKRRLYIRTFAVVPLTEESGMIEWVLHTRGLRHILQDLYVGAGLFDRKNTNPLIKKLYDEQGQKPGGEMLRTKILPLFPPIFHRWFLNSFPEPAAWFRARLAYTHTSAVWSMVGHVLGLGDRHGENILFDSTTGDCVHVDFSCLFDKGLTLEKPELVPFRLTQNMVDGFGITGYEGTFLQICEITLSTLRTHRETLMSVLEPFIHDPLVEWTKIHKSSGVEMQNPHAQRAIASIQARLKGVVVGVGAAPSLPLSVEGQAHRLITEAVSHENLEKMYIWWMAWF